MRRILVLNGPNINMLGTREKAIYGRRDYESLCAYIRSAALRVGVEVELLQSNYEGDIVTAIQRLTASLMALSLILRPSHIIALLFWMR